MQEKCSVMSLFNIFTKRIKVTQIRNCVLRTLYLLWESVTLNVKHTILTLRGAINSGFWAQLLNLLYKRLCQSLMGLFFFAGGPLRVGCWLLRLFIFCVVIYSGIVKEINCQAALMAASFLYSFYLRSIHLFQVKPSSGEWRWSTSRSSS